MRFGGRSNGRKFDSNLKNRCWTCNEYYVATGAGIEPDLPEIDLRLTPEAMFIKTFGLPSSRYFDLNGPVDAAHPADTSDISVGGHPCR